MYLCIVQDWIIVLQMCFSFGLVGVDMVGGYVKEYGIYFDSV